MEVISGVEARVFILCESGSSAADTGALSSHVVDHGISDDVDPVLGATCGHVGKLFAATKPPFDLVANWLVDGPPCTSADVFLRRRCDYPVDPSVA